MPSDDMVSAGQQAREAANALHDDLVKPLPARPADEAFTRALSGQRAAVPELPGTRNWIFTFGFGQRPLRFVTIRGTADSSREAMLFRFGNAWSHQYATREAAGVERYGLIEIDYTTGKDIER